MSNVVKTVSKQSKKSANEVIISYGSTGAGKTYTMVDLDLKVDEIFNLIFTFCCSSALEPARESYRVLSPISFSSWKQLRTLTRSSCPWWKSTIASTLTCWISRRRRVSKPLRRSCTCGSPLTRISSSTSRTRRSTIAAKLSRRDPV